jgi:hypothetical protein
MNPPATDLCLNPSPAHDCAAVLPWRRLLCVLLGHRDVHTRAFLFPDEPLYRVFVCARCHRRRVEILRD